MRCSPPGLILVLLTLVLTPARAWGQDPLAGIGELYQAGRYAEALTLVEEYLEAHPDSAEAWAWKGNLLGGLSATSETAADAARYGMGATRAIERALRLDPDNVSALHGKAWLKLMTPAAYGGDVDEAIALFRQALDRADDPGLVAAIRVGLARAWEADGQRDRALAELDAALQLDPGNEDAAGLLASLRAWRPDATIEAIAVEGNHHTRREFIVRGLTFELGDVIDPAELARSRERWLATGHFEEVEIQVAPLHDDEHVVVTVAVTEAPAVSFGFYPLLLSYDRLGRRWNRLGVSAFVDKEWETRSITLPYAWARVFYELPAHPRTRLSLRAEAGYRFFPWITRSGDPEGPASISSYRLHTGWLGVDLRRDLGDVMSVGVRDRLHYFGVTHLAAGVGDPFFAPGDPGGGYLDNHVGFWLDVRLPLPRSEPVTSLELRAEQTLGLRALGARHDFSQTRVRLVNRWFLHPRVQLLLRLEGMTSFGTIPHWQQFNIGDEGGLRGYTVFDHLGMHAVLASVELRLLVLSLGGGNLQLEVAPLFDIGEAWTAGERVALDRSLPLNGGLAVYLYSAPGRTLRVRFDVTVNRDGRFLFSVTGTPPI